MHRLVECLSVLLVVVLATEVFGHGTVVRREPTQLVRLSWSCVEGRSATLLLYHWKHTEIAVEIPPPGAEFKSIGRTVYHKHEFRWTTSRTVGYGKGNLGYRNALHRAYQRVPYPQGVEGGRRVH